MENKESIEVTSIAKEEAKAEGKVELPSEEEIVRSAELTFNNKLDLFVNVFEKLSVKQKSRVMRAVLDLPSENTFATLKKQEEKLAFSAGQKLLRERFILTAHQIRKEVERIKLTKENKNEQQ